MRRNDEGCQSIPECKTLVGERAACDKKALLAKNVKTQIRKGPPNKKPVQITSIVDLDDQEVKTEVQRETVQNHEIPKQNESPKTVLNGDNSLQL